MTRPPTRTLTAPRYYEELQDQVAFEGDFDLILRYYRFSLWQYLKFIREAQPELAQVGFYGAHFWSLGHTPQFGEYPAHFPVRGLDDRTRAGLGHRAHPFILPA